MKKVKTAFINAGKKPVVYKTKNFIIAQFKDWTAFEALLLGSGLATMILFGVFSDYAGTYKGMDVAAMLTTAGVITFLSTMLGAKGKASTFILGPIGAIFWIITSLAWGNIANVIAQAAFGIPMNFLGAYTWLKNQAPNHKSVLPKRMCMSGIALVALAFMFAYVIYGVFVPVRTGISTQQHWFDALSLIVMIFAMILMVMRYTEQWYLWILVNIANIGLNLVMLKEKGSAAIVGITQYAFSLANAIYGIYNWLKVMKNIKFQEFKKLNKEEIKALSFTAKLAYYTDLIFAYKHKKVELVEVIQDSKQNKSQEGSN